MPTINFSIDETTSANAQAAATALRSLTQEYQKLNRVLVKTEKQLLKFDEINRLVAYADKPVSAGRTSSGRSSSSSKSTTKKTETTPKAGSTAGGKSNGYTPRDTSASLPLHLAIRDIFFEWGNLNWEVILMKLIAGVNAVGLGAIGLVTAGPAGLALGVTAGLLFSILADATIFNFDGKVQPEELRKALYAILPVAGAGVGLIAGGPAGALIGLAVGTFLSLKLIGLDWSDAERQLNQFFTDLHDFFDLRFQSVSRFFHESIDGLKTWWSNLSFRGFHLSLPHLQVQWEMLNANSALARFLGISAVPHLSVQWYARGGIVNGATLIGAGEQGKEAIVPLERHTEWIRLVAAELRAQLEALGPAHAFALYPLPAATTGSLIPPSALQSESRPSLDGLADAIVSAISSLQADSPEPVIRVYLDGKQLSDAITKYQRRDARAKG
ncbi:MAG: hypothetical protein II873_01980 [Oscillospiraceae bacterium]|nr:hypothetical protein [Oscillospiraceae bacterium]